jgi:hypothetical protein
MNAGTAFQRRQWASKEHARRRGMVGTPRLELLSG